MRKWHLVSDQGGEIVEMSPWAIQALTRGARAGTDETFATTATGETTGVAAGGAVNQLQAGSGTMPRAKTSTRTDQAQEGTSAHFLPWLTSRLIVPVRQSHALVACEDAVPPRPLTKKATADSGLPSTKRTQAVGGTAAEVVAVTTAVVANPAWIVGRTTVPTTIVRMALQLADVGRRTLSLLTLHQWATTIGQTL